MSEKSLISFQRGDRVHHPVSLVLSAFLSGILLFMALAKLIDIRSILIRDDHVLYIGATIIEIVAGACLLLFPGFAIGWIISLLLGICFSIYSWLDDQPSCRCLGSFRDLDRQERYLIALLIATLSCLGLAILHSRRLRTS